MLPDCNFLSYIIVICNCNMENCIQKKSVRLAVLSVGAMFIASFASSAHSELASAQQNKTSMQPSAVLSTQGVQSMTTASALYSREGHYD